jgi:hypothetical protein
MSLVHWYSSWMCAIVKGKMFTIRTSHDSPEGKQRYYSTLSLTLAVDGVGGQCHAPATVLLWKKPSAHCMRIWLDPRVGLDGCGKSHPHQDSMCNSRLWYSDVEPSNAVTEVAVVCINECLFMESEGSIWTFDLIIFTGPKTCQRNLRGWAWLGTVQS